jgi:putative hydrolase of the HAD superfamily
MKVPALSPSQWAHIDTVLLDMDGTVLDLAFDNHFWRSHVPEAWGRQRSLSAQQALEQLKARFRACEGTLNWYCVDYWSRELELDIPALKERHSERIRWLPGAREFLQQVRALGKRLVLITNSHPKTLAIKDARTQVISHFDAGFSSHSFGAPKEEMQFWRELAKVEHFDPARSLFVDDSQGKRRFLAASAGGGTLRLGPNVVCR